MNRMLALGAFLLLSSASAIASDWVQVFANSGEAVSVDKDSVARSGDTVNAWTQTVLAVETDVQLGRPAKAIKTQYVADCQARTLLVNALIFYDAQGNVLASLPPEHDAPAVVVPGTGGDFILRAVCSKG
ncbi:surface-adhesin E family protein [Caballeronia sp. LjRoot31]|jgi:hypothetical protein|uniref:surface-adhesin E family protein n=1 Tax=Caballeronia sp. LjRoot31 TaxID=3342324 RepID=UPI003ED0C48F